MGGVMMQRPRWRPKEYPSDSVGKQTSRASSPSAAGIEAPVSSFREYASSAAADGPPRAKQVLTGIPEETAADVEAATQTRVPRRWKSEKWLLGTKYD